MFLQICKNEDDPTNEEDRINENDPKNEDDTKNEDDLDNEDNLKNENYLNYEGDLKNFSWVKFPFKRVSLLVILIGQRCDRSFERSRPSRRSDRSMFY